MSLKTTYQKRCLAALLLFIALLIALPLLLKGSPYIVNVLIVIFYTTTMSLAWNLLGGMTGQNSLGHAAYMGLGAYIGALLITKGGWNPWLTIPVAMLIVGLIAGVVFYPCFLLKGPYFTLVSIAFGETIRQFMLNWDFAGKAMGIPLAYGKPSFLEFRFHSKTPYYYIALVMVVCVYLLMRKINKSKLGFALKTIREDEDVASAIGIKPISEFGSKRLVRMAIQYAIDHKLPNVTLVHKGNIMKFTEGGFRRWGYEVAAEEFGDVTITEEEVTKNFGGKAPEGKIVIKDRITDAMFQQILLRPAEYSVLALPNLNGDYMSDALAAEVGGLGMAPGSNIGEGYAIFEATHGTAPKYAGQDKTNPGSIILSGALMLEYIGWKEAAELIRKAVEKTVAAKTVTYDLARQMPGATKISCSAFGKAICEHM